MAIQKYIIGTLLFFLLFFSSVFAQYSVKRQSTGNATKFGDKNNINYQVFDIDNEVYSINIEIDYDVPIPALKVFDDGAGVLINSFDASLTFFNSEGTELLKVKIRKDLQVEYERTVHSYISGNYMVISLSQTDKNYSIIQIYNNQGNLINEWKLNENQINGMSYSHVENIIAVSIINWTNKGLSKLTRFYYDNGSEIIQVNANFTKGFFINNTNIFIGYISEKYFLFDYFKNDMKIDKSVHKEDMVLSVENINNEIFVVSAKKPILNSGKWFYKNPTIFQYDLMGNSKSQYKLESNLFSEFQFFETDTGLIFKTEDQLFQVK